MAEDQPERTRKVTVVERVAIVMSYDEKQRDWSTDMTDFRKQWWLAKATIGLNEVNRIIQAKHGIEVGKGESTE